MNKKGQIEEVVNHLPYLILTVLIMAGLYFLLSYYSTTTINVEPIQVNIFLYRSLYQQNGLSHTDKATGKVSPGLVYAEDFTSKHLDESMKYTYEKQIMAKFEIIDNKYKNSLATAYYNELWYNRLEPIAFSRLPGIGGANAYTKELPILYKSGDQSTPATLKVTVIMPR